MAHSEESCSYGKKCKRMSSCTKNHKCTFGKRCTKGDECRFIHDNTAKNNRNHDHGSSPPPSYDEATKRAQELADAFEDGLKSPILLGVAAAAADDCSICPEIKASNIETLSPASVKQAAEVITSKLSQIAEIIAMAQYISLCFVMDTTGSMQAHIAAAKEQIGTIVQKLQEKKCQIMGLAFVGYKDWCDGDDHFEVLPFTSSIDSFKAKLSSITAKGGGDLPEDVLGGLNCAAKLTWPAKSGSKMIFHIGDAPPHGQRFHSLRSGQDSYFNGHPKDPKVEDIFEILTAKRIEYFFGEHGNGVCTKMKAVFGALIDRDPSDMSYDVTDTAMIADSVTKSALKCVSMSALRASKGLSKDRPYKLELAKPNLSRLPEIKAVSIAFDMPENIDDCCSTTRSLTWIRRNTSIRLASQPFSKGAARLAYFGVSIFRSKGSHAADALFSEDEVVLKEFITLPSNHTLDAARYFADLEAQTVASKMAMEFSQALESIVCSFKIKFLKSTLIRIAAADGSSNSRYMAMEKLYRGGVQMVKYTNNHAYVNTTNLADANWSKKIDLLLAFSHFTYSRTRGYLVVTDLQGISGGDIDPSEIILTDPAIHCAKAPRFGVTNTMRLGIEAFIGAHVCTPICKALGLPKLK